MSSTIEAPAQINGLQVRTDPAGKPLAIRHNGTIWIVDPDTDSRHWYARELRGDTRRTAVVGGDDPVSVELWCVQVRSGTHSELRTVTLRREAPSKHWILEDFSGVEEATDN